MAMLVSKDGRNPNGYVGELAQMPLCALSPKVMNSFVAGYSVTCKWYSGMVMCEGIVRAEGILHLVLLHF